MFEFSVFVYGFLTAYILMCAQENRRLSRPNPRMVTVVGWGLFSMSSALAVLLGSVALAVVLGLHVPDLSNIALR